MHGFTYMNHPVACAAGLANIEIIEEEGLVQKAAENGAYLLEGLKTLTKYDSVGDVRGMGMLAAIELVADKETKMPIEPENAAPEMLVELCWQKGLSIRSSTMETACIAPALTMDRPTIDRIVETLDACIPEMEGKLLK
jgi:adenosylmethionine-8-amino-7-oxononanoate aminotransferase